MFQHSGLQLHCCTIALYIHCSVYVCVTGCVAVTVGSDSEDDDNDEEEEDDKECLKKLRRKVCMHV